MKILAFDCSGKTMAAAVAQGSEVLAAEYSDENRNHAPHLLPMIDKVLSLASFSYSDLEAIGVTVGPGSFTGLRIGIATAKGLSDTLGIPLIPILSMDALALGFAGHRNIIATISDARKKQVYAAVYDNTAGKMEKIMEETPLSPVDELLPFLSKFKKILFVGDGVAPWRAELLAAYGERCCFADDDVQGIKGESLIKIAAAAKNWDLTRDVLPFYLRGVDAKAKFLRCDFSLLTKNDIEELMRVEESAFASPWTRQMFLDELANSFSEYWIIRVDGRLAAYGGFWLVADECHITNIAVDADYHHLGLGTLMVKHLIQRGRGLGVKGITLEVRPSNIKAIKLYEKAGFKEMGRRSHYYEDNGEDAIIMWLYFADDDKQEKPWSKK